MATGYYEVADEDCEWMLLGWMKLKCWHGVPVTYFSPTVKRPFVPLTDEVLRILEALAAEAAHLPECLVR